MYAVIKTGGKQYRVKPGDTLVVEKLAGEAGAEVSFDQVLMLGEGADVTLGAPLVDGALVKATLMETRKGEKIKIFKKIRRQGYRRTRGHRQFESVLRVISIVGDGKSESWDGTVDLTPLAVLTARARGLKSLADALVSGGKTAAKAKAPKAPAKVKVKATPEPEAKPEPKAKAEPKAAPAKAEAAAAPAEAKPAKAKTAKPAAPKASVKAPSKADARPKAAKAAPARPAPKTSRPKGKG